MRKLITSLLVATMGLTLAGCQNPVKDVSSSKPVQTVSAKNDDSLAKLNYQSGQQAYVNVNNDKATIKYTDFTNPSVKYANLDKLNRTSSPNIGYLTSKNVANDSLRTTQTVQPTGWHQKFVKNEAILNRGHEIAYSLSKGISMTGQYQPTAQSGDQNNPKNLFTQTAFSNQEVQTIFESKVRTALKEGQKVVYQVQPIFSGNDLMAKGVHMQAISNNGKLNFNVYLYNVQPGIKFDYTTGRSTIDNSMKVPTPAGAPHFNDNGNQQTGYRSGYHKHHWLRDYLIYRGVKHVIARHYERRGYERGFTDGSAHHSFFHHNSRW